MRREVSFLPLNHHHDHIPNTKLYLLDYTLLPTIYPVVRLYVPPCWYGVERESWLLKEVVDSSC